MSQCLYNYLSIALSCCSFSSSFLYCSVCFSLPFVAVFFCVCVHVCTCVHVCVCACMLVPVPRLVQGLFSFSTIPFPCSYIRQIRQASLSKAMGIDTPDTPIIKQMVYLRGKYRKKDGAPTKVVHCELIVPHPGNRGGCMITSARCRDLCAEIVSDGYDPVEACVSNLLVEAAVVNGVVDRTYTDHFVTHAGNDNGHFISMKPALYGALCHNTGNLINRNIFGGRLGCVCDPPAMAGKCTCKAKPLLDAKGNYSL